MRFKTCFLLLVVVFLAIDGINGKGSSKRKTTTRTPPSTKRRTSHPNPKIPSTTPGYISTRKPVPPSHTTTTKKKPIGFWTTTPRPIRSPSGPVTSQEIKNINEKFIKAEGGGASKQSQTPSRNSSSIGATPGSDTKGKQPPSVASPQVPENPVTRPSTGNGVTYHPGHLPTRQANHSASPTQAPPSLSNPRVGVNQTIHPIVQPSTYGVKDYVYPTPPPQQSVVFTQPVTYPYEPGKPIVILQGQQDSQKGIGEMIKEMIVTAAVQKGVDNLFNSNKHHNIEKKPPQSHPGSITYVTNNNYYNTAAGANGTMNPPNVAQGNGPTNNNQPGINAPNAGTNTPNAVSNTQETSTANPNIVDNTPSYRISDDELAKITEDLFVKSPNISKYIKLNLQNRTTSPNVTDGAKHPLFEIGPELLDFPTISVTRTLYDSYEHDSRKKLNRTVELRKHENLLMDTFLNTNVMATTMQWLADRGFIDRDDFERKDVIHRVWFTMFNRSSCGFERVFASENYGTDLIGVQDWIYFENQETLKRIDYMGYADKLNLGNTSSLLKLNFQMDGIVKPNATIFVGTMPELEMSLYTICFYARPNNVCPVSLGGTKFYIYTHSFTYLGKDLIDLALPVF